MNTLNKNKDSLDVFDHSVSIDKIIERDESAREKSSANGVFPFNKAYKLIDNAIKEEKI